MKKTPDLLEKPIICYYDGHDANITVYEIEKKKFTIIEFERLSGIKHHPTKYFAKRHNTKWLQHALDFLEKNHGIKNDYSLFFYKSYMYSRQTKMKRHFDRTASTTDTSIVNCLEHLPSIALHHDAHAYSAIAQSPSHFNNCCVLSWDNGGDDENNVFYEVKNSRIVSRSINSPWCARMYTIGGQYVSSIDASTEDIDVAGKLMGFSAYGEITERTEELIYQLKYHAGLDESHPWPYKRDWFRQRELRYREWIAKQYPYITLRHDTEDSIRLNEEDEKEFAYALQHFFDDCLIHFVTERLDTIRKNGNKLIITGGCALNVLSNERVKRLFPDIEIFVPPNPHDGGLTMGIIAKHLYENAFIDQHRFDVTYSGATLMDPEYLQTLKHRETSISEMSSLLKQGKIIGLVQGGSEVGPRALGNRSILCDPSYPDMKDILNKKVKFREWYRPFAPVCRLDDAEKFCYTTSYKYYNYMSFVVDILPEYEEQLSAVTHVDGTARLQTVARENNALLYDLLTEFDGVLLNTSFNVQGKPILNSIKDANHVLQNTGLDAFVVLQDDKLYIVEK